MHAIRFLLLSAVLLIGACAPSPPKPRGMFDLSNSPEPGATGATPSLGPTAHTGAGRLGGP